MEGGNGGGEQLNNLYNSAAFGLWANGHKILGAEPDAVRGLSSPVANLAACYGSRACKNFAGLRESMQSCAATTSEILAYSPLAVTPAGTAAVSDASGKEQPCFGCTQSFVEMLLRLLKYATGEFVVILFLLFDGECGY